MNILTQAHYLDLLNRRHVMASRHDAKGNITSDIITTSQNHVRVSRGAHYVQ